MENEYCSVCGNDNTENKNFADSTVFIICDECLNSEQLSPKLDKIFLG